MKTVKCCTKALSKPSFAEIKIINRIIDITLTGSPCCNTEFESFLCMLDTIVSDIRRKNENITQYVLVYDISKCAFKRKYMTAQESRLDMFQVCAIIVNDIIAKKLISIMVKRKKTNQSDVTIVNDRSAAIKWVSSIQSKSL